MSTTIDQKVVEMKFDNSNFEKNVGTTMSTLQKLKAALNLDGSAKGLDELNKASENNKISKLGEAAEAVGKKFTVLETIATGALLRIGSQAVSAGERLVKSIAFDQINAGFEKYGEKTQAMQTIMAATSKSADEVNEHMKKLLWFADETSYSFTDMTNNIGKFTANQVPLEQAVTAMEGISTWAAISGQNTEAASRAMYNLSQAIGVGSVKLQDWKSIENANMATAQFKQTVLDTAVEMGILTKKGEGATAKYYKFGKQIEKNEVSVSNFSSTLKDGWFSSDLLIKTLGKYGEYSDGLNEVYETLADLGPEYSKTTSEIINDMKKLKGADDNTILSKGYTQDLIPLIRELSNNADSLGAKAFAAAQEALTFSQAIEATKDAVSSQWMQTFEYIFGGINTARKMWTDLANELWDIFAAGGENRNIFLRYLDQKGALADFRDSCFRVLKNVFRMITLVKESFANIFPGPAADKVVEMIRRFDRFTRAIEITDNVIDALNGDYVHLSYNEQKVYDNLVKLRSAFEGIISVFKIFTTIIGSVIKIFVALAQEIFPSLKTGALDVAASMGEFLKSFSEAIIERINKWTDAIIDFIHAFKDFPVVKQAITYINTFIDGFKKAYDSFTGININFLRAFNDFKAIMAEFFNPSDAAKENLALRNLKTLQGYLLDFTHSEKVVAIADRIQSKLQDLKTFISNFKMPEMKSNIFNWLQHIAEGFSSGGFLQGLKNSLDWIKKLFSNKFIKLKDSFIIQMYKLGQKFGPQMEKGFELLKKAFLGLKSFIFGTKDITVESITEIATKIAALVLLIKGINILDGISDIFEGIGDSLKNLSKAAKWTALSSIIKSVAWLLVSIAVSLAIIGSLDTEQLRKGVITLGIMAFIVGALITAIMLLSKNMSGFLTGGWKDAFMLAGLALVVGSIASAVTKLVKNIKELGDMKKRELTRGIEALVAIMLALTLAVSIIGKACRGSSAMSTGVILAFVLGLQKILNVIAEYDEFFKKGDYTVGLHKMYELMLALALCVRLMSTKVGKDEKAVSNCFSILAFVLALKLMLAGVKELGEMPMDQMIQGLAGIFVLVAMLTGAIVAMNLTSKSGILKKGERSINQFKGIAGALVALCLAIYILGNMDTAILVKGGIAAAACMGVLAIFSRIAGQASGIKTGNLVALFIGLTLVVLALSHAVKSMSTLGATNAITILLGIASIFVTVGYLVQSMRTLMYIDAGDILKLVGIFAVLGVAIYALSQVLILLSKANVDGSNAIKQMAAIDGTLLVMTKIIETLQSMPDFEKGDEKKIFKCIGMMAVLGLLILEVGYFISLIQKMGIDGKAAIPQVIAISLLMGALTGVLAACTALARFNIPKGNLAGILLSLVGVGAITLAVIRYVLKPLMGVNVSGAAPKITALGFILLEMVGVLSACVLLSRLNVNTESLAMTELVLIGVGVVILEAVGILKTIENLNVDGTPKKIEAIALMLLAMVGVLTACTVLEKFGASFKGTGGLVVILGGMSLIVGLIAGILYAIQDVDGGNAILQATAISEFLIVMAGIMALLTTLKVDFVTASAAALALGAFIDILVLLLEGLAYILARIGAASDLVELAKCMTLLGEAIGGFAGGIASGFLDELSTSLPAFGKALGDFYTNAEPFFNGIKSFGKDIAEGMASLAGGLIVLTAAEVIDGVAKFVNESASLSSIGKDLSDFWNNAKIFFSGIKSIDEKTLSSAESLSRVLLAITAAELMDSISKWATLFTGDNSISEFGDSLADFGRGLTRFSNNITDVNADKIESIIPAVDALVTISNKMENSGGLLKFITGDNTWDEYGTQLASFGRALCRFGEKCKEIVDNGYDTTISSMLTPIKALVDISHEIENSGGLLGLIVGNNQFDDLGEGLGSFGRALVTFGIKCKEIITNGYDQYILKVKDPIIMLEEVAGDIENAGGALAFLVGDNTWDSLSQGLANFGCALKSFGISVVGLDGEAIINSIPAIKELAAAMDEMPNMGGALNSFFGEGNWTSLGTDLGLMGDALIQFANAVKQDNALQSHVQIGIATLKDLATLSTITISPSDLKDLGNTFKDFCINFSVGASNITQDKIDMLPVFAVNMKTLVQALSDISDIKIDDISNFGQALSELGLESISALSDSILTNGATVITAFKTMLTDAIAACRGELYQFNMVGSEIITNMVGGIKLNGDAIKYNLTIQIQSALNYVKGKRSEFFSTGQYLVDGFISGMGSKSQAVIDKAVSLARAAKEAMEAELQINSPSRVLKAIGEYFSQGFAEGISNDSGQAEQASRDMANSAVGAVIAMSDAFSSALGENQETFTQFGVKIIESISTGIANSQETIATSFTELMSNMLLGIDNTETSSETSMKTLLEGMLTIISQYKIQYYTTGQDIVKRMIDGIKSESYYLKLGWDQLMEYSLRYINNYRSNFYSAGRYVGEGFVEGIRSQISSAAQAAAEMAAAAIAAARANLNINSPSKVFAEIGGYVGQGFVNGIADYNKASANAGESLAMRAVKAATELIENGIDTEPVIRPVLDLTNVEEGTKNLSAMLSRNQALTINAQLNQNGAERQSNNNQTASQPNNTTFIQNNYSPKALSRIEIYRQTSNQLSRMNGALV